VGFTIQFHRMTTRGVAALRRPLGWFLLGVLSVFAARWVIDNTALADRLIAPLIVQDTSGQADAIVVLGAGVTASCSPNEFSLRRIVLATRLYRHGRAPAIFITGGTPKDAPCAISEGMARIARDLGVPAEAITLERRSRTTWENALYTAPLLRAAGASRILLVTDRLHMKRGQQCFKRFGFAIERATVPIFEATTGNTSMLYWGLREMAALAAYRWRGFIGDGPVANPEVVEDGIEGPIMVRHANGPVVLLGASYAKGWDVKAFAGLPVANAGVAGQQSAEMLARFDQDVVRRSPRAVVIWGFINDIFRAPPGGLDTAIEAVKRNFEQMVASARAAGIEPILATEVTIRHPKGFAEDVKVAVGGLLGKQGYADRINAQVMKTNGWLREFARREHLLLLDIQPPLSDAAGRRKAAFSGADGSHFSAEGYAALTDYATPILEAHLRR
jgi:uncharacterized SAM-binding protein YcdF (DUF218 family)/lysophospholipase L1-like esterase